MVSDRGSGSFHTGETMTLQTPLELLALNPHSLEYGDRVRTPDGRAAWIVRCGLKYALLDFSEALPNWEVGKRGKPYELKYLSRWVEDNTQQLGLFSGGFSES